ncbi:MAG: Ca-activated chloride channel [Thermoleophilaceae bacterium]|nr:Ca-activated chloride channel [Thermoleophilaceae bacterium]
MSSFGAPVYLLTLLVVPLALLAYLAARRRARRYAVRFTAVPALKLAGAVVPPWRRHLPAVLALTALASLALATAKPQRTVAVPRERSNIMLVSDHSRSMLANDLDPDRLTAAQDAARTFIDRLPSQVRIGVVAFSTTPDTVQSPSDDHGDARRVIDSQVADGATATGDALQVALDALQRQRENGKRPPSAIVLLSDGKTTTGRDPLPVADAAKRMHIPINTVSVGTTEATVPNPGFGPPLPAIPDPETLRAIADSSGGRAFSAEDSSQLSAIYKRLGSQLGTKQEQHESTSAFALAGLLLLVGAVGASSRVAGRLP